MADQCSLIAGPAALSAQLLLLIVVLLFLFYKRCVSCPHMEPLLLFVADWSTTSNDWSFTCACGPVGVMVSAAFRAVASDHPRYSNGDHVGFLALSRLSVRDRVVLCTCAAASVHMPLQSPVASKPMPHS